MWGEASGKEGGASRGRKFVIALVLLSVSLCISVLAGEVILRLMGYHGAPEAAIGKIYMVHDPVLDWRHVPNVQIVRGQIMYKYNKSGFRDAEHAVENASGVKRIVVVGDSVTEGYGVNVEYTFSQRIQAELGNSHEVITIAAGGLNTPQEVHLFEKEGVQYKPELVVLNFILNDCDFYTRFRAARRYNEEKESQIALLNVPIDPELKRLLKSSAFIYFMKERMEDLKGRILGVDKVDYFTRIWSREENRAKVMRGFDRLGVLQNKNKFDVLVMIWPLITDYERYGFASIHSWVHEQAEKRGFAAIDLLAEFSNVRFRDLQVTAEDNIHPNVLGHKIAAEAFLDWYKIR